jgi:hypothetical protein
LCLSTDQTWSNLCNLWLANKRHPRILGLGLWGRLCRHCKTSDTEDMRRLA